MQSIPACDADGYETIRDGVWFVPAKRVKLGCCSCGVVHSVEFRIRRGQIEMRATQDEKATAQLRKHEP